MLYKEDAQPWESVSLSRGSVLLVWDQYYSLIINFRRVLSLTIATAVIHVVQYGGDVKPFISELLMSSPPCWRSCGAVVKYRGGGATWTSPSIFL